MSAIRLARGFTGRDVIVKFDGCYHGHVDALLVAAGSGVATFGLPDSAGVPRSSAGETIVLPYNDVAALEGPSPSAGRDRRGHRRARRRQHGRRPAAPGFIEALLRVNKKHGALLIFDEVMTGFRCAPPALRPRGAEPQGARPVHLGQGHRRRLPDRRLRRPRRRHGPARAAGPVYQAGTLSGNPLATAAGLATLQGCTADVYDRLDAARTPSPTASEALTAASCRTGSSGPARCSRSSSATGPSHYDDAKDQDSYAFRRFFHGCSSPGVHLPPSASSRGSSPPPTMTRRSSTCGGPTGRRPGRRDPGPTGPPALRPGFEVIAAATGQPAITSNGRGDRATRHTASGDCGLDPRGGRWSVTAAPSGCRPDRGRWGCARTLHDGPVPSRHDRERHRTRAGCGDAAGQGDGRLCGTVHGRRPYQRPVHRHDGLA